MSKDIENSEQDHDYVKRPDRCSDTEEIAQNEPDENNCENKEPSNNVAKKTDPDKILALKTLHLQKALNQLITICNTHNLGTSQRKQILKILPVFIEHNIEIFDDEYWDVKERTKKRRSAELDKQTKKSDVSPEIDELMNSIEQDFMSLSELNQISSQNQTNHNHKVKITTIPNHNQNEPKSSLDIEKHEEKIYQLDCALGIDKITSNMGKFEEMNKKFNALLEKQLPGQKKEFLKFFRKSSQLASALKQNKDFEEDK